MPTIYVLSKNMKIVKIFQPKIAIFIAVKNRCILHGRVFVISKPNIHVESAADRLLCFRCLLCIL